MRKEARVAIYSELTFKAEAVGVGEVAIDWPTLTHLTFTIGMLKWYMRVRGSRMFCFLLYKAPLPRWLITIALWRARRQSGGMPDASKTIQIVNMIYRLPAAFNIKQYRNGVEQKVYETKL
jgi:hypothetical protein